MNLMVYGLISYKNDPIKSFNMWTCLFLLPSRDMYKSYSTLICLWKIKCRVGLYYCGRQSVLRDHSSLWRRHHAVCWWGDQKILCIVKNYICLYEKRWNDCTCSKLSPENWSQARIHWQGMHQHLVLTALILRKKMCLFWVNCHSIFTNSKAFLWVD